MGVVVLSSAAFAGTTSVNYRGIASGSALAADTVVPEQKDTVKSEPVKTETDPVQFALNDTVVPEQKDTVKSDPVQFALNDTVVPEQKDTVAPKK